MTYLLSHGFGFDNSYWRNLIPLLDDEYEFFNHGFCFSTQKSYVGIGHSLGFLKLNNSGIKFHALVGLQGFLNFGGSVAEHRIMILKNLDRMVAQCKLNPSRFLSFFRNLCGYQSKITLAELSIENLLQDLTMMKSAYNHCGAPTLILGSHQDKIVESAILEDNFEHQNVIIKYIDGVNHTLGFTNPNQVFEQIKNFMQNNYAERTD